MQYNCDLWEDVKTPEDCKAKYEGLAPEAVVTPDKAKEYEHTQKMLHYTIIFQIFVFM